MKLEDFEGVDEQEGSNEITLLVLERGAEWPSWGTGIRMRAMNSAVEAQTDSETMEEFQKRVETRLSRIAQESMSLRAAGYACALSNEGRTDVRRQICARILTDLSTNERGELILAGGSWGTTGEEGRRRAELIELWGELSSQVHGHMISVRFEEKPSESGVFRAAPDVRAMSDEVPASGFPETEASSRPSSSHKA